MKLNPNIDVPSIEMVGGLFPKGYFSTVYGKAGTGKSWFVLRTVCNCSCGGNVWDFLSYNEPERKCIIFCGENGENMYIQRLKRTKLDVIPDNVSLYGSGIATGEKNMLLDSEEGFKNICRIFEEEKPDLVFFDTLLSYHLADENSQKDMTAIYQRINRIAKKYNVAIVLIHHSRKSQGDNGKAITQDDAIGTSALSRLSASMFSLAKQSDETIILKCQKTWLKSPQILGFLLEDDDETIEIKVDPYCSLYVGSKSDIFTKFILAQKVGMPFELSEAFRRSGIDKSNGYKILNKMIAEGKVEKSQTQGFYFLNR